MLTYQYLICCGHNWQLVYTHFTFGKAKKKKKKEKNTKLNFMLCIGNLHILWLVPKFNQNKMVTSCVFVWPCHSVIQLYLMLNLLGLVVELYGSDSLRQVLFFFFSHQPSNHTSVFQVMCYLAVLVGLFVLQVLCNII